MISVFTPVHAVSAPFLLEAYQSLCDQTYQDFEWVIVLNNGGWVVPEIHLDPRVKAVVSDLNGVGALKRYACGMCSGGYLFEMDGDDLLAPTALGECMRAFSDPNVMVVYSNCCEFMDGTWEPELEYSEVYGWRYRSTAFRGHKAMEAVAWPATYHSMRRVLWSPNHFRAFRASSYNEIGGHDQKLALGDDFDLLCRYYVRYGQKGFCHVDQPLYGYRVHDGNTVKTRNAELQRQMGLLYLAYIEPMALKWATDHELDCYDLGGGINRAPHKEYRTVDLHNADVICDLNGMWPMADNSCGVISARHLIEHLNNRIHFFNEAYRVLAPGGLLMLEVPSLVGVDGKSIGLGAIRDPSHLSFSSEDTIRYFTQERFARFIRPAYKGRFQESRIETWEMEPNVPVITAELIRLGEPYESRHAGEILI